MKKEMICIVCPIGCHLHVEMQNNEVLQVSGNTCNRGEAYARAESICPMRTLTTTLRVLHGSQELVPVMTSKSVPKSLLFDIMALAQKHQVEAPIHCRDILMKNVANSGADLLASCDVEKEG